MYGIRPSVSQAHLVRATWGLPPKQLLLIQMPSGIAQNRKKVDGRDKGHEL